MNPKKRMGGSLSLSENEWFSCGSRLYFFLQSYVCLCEPSNSFYPSLPLRYLLASFLSQSEYSLLIYNQSLSVDYTSSPSPLSVWLRTPLIDRRMCVFIIFFSLSMPLFWISPSLRSVASFSLPPSCPGDLPLVQGQWVREVADVDSGWLLGENQKGHRGLVPRTYLKQMDPKEWDRNSDWGDWNRPELIVWACWKVVRSIQIQSPLSLGELCSNRLRV